LSRSSVPNFLADLLYVSRFPSKFCSKSSSTSEYVTAFNASANCGNVSLVGMGNLTYNNIYIYNINVSVIIPFRVRHVSFITTDISVSAARTMIKYVGGATVMEGKPSNLNRHCCTVLGRFRAARWLLGHDKPIFLQLVWEKVKNSYGNRVCYKNYIYNMKRPRRTNVDALLRAIYIYYPVNFYLAPNVINKQWLCTSR